MLKYLHISNYALISELQMEFEPGFSVITGETGAGKSIIIGALSLILGQRADSRAIKEGEQKCVIEASFDITGYGLEPFFQDNELDYDADNCLVRRELTAAGKSRAFVNDTPVSLAQLRELGNRLIDIHSQHENLLLSNEGCGRCARCTYPDAPCRFPELLHHSLEGYGWIVKELADAAGIRYHNGPNTVTYFGALLFCETA